MITQLKMNETVNLYEGGYVTRDFIHIDDCINAINLVITKGELNTIYNIGTGYPTMLWDVITDAKVLLKSSSPIEAVPTPDFHKIVQVKSMYMDATKLFSLGFTPKYKTSKEWLPELI